MTAWGVTLRAALVATALLASCSDDGDDGAMAGSERPSTTTAPTTTSTAPERPASTTTTAYDPAAVEGQVEAAYLKSWDVYAEAVYNLELDEEALAEVYADDAYRTLVEEVRRRIEDHTPSLVRVDHEYTISVGDAMATVIDHFVNHQVLVDPETLAPIEPDPNERTLINFQLRRIDGAWKVISIERITS